MYPRKQVVLKVAVLMAAACVVATSRRFEKQHVMDEIDSSFSNYFEGDMVLRRSEVQRLKRSVADPVNATSGEGPGTWISATIDRNKLIPGCDIAFVA